MRPVYRLSWKALTAAGAGMLLGITATRRSAMTFRDRTVLITGGSRGLGLILARLFAREGARVALCGRDAETLERARAELARQGARVFAKTCDIRDRAEVEALVPAVREALGPIDVLVNNAGVIQAGPLEAMRTEDFAESMETHFWGPLHAALAVLPEMKARGEGRIVNIASVGGKLAVPHLAPYCAGKFALVGLSDALRLELAAHGILVTTVCPGLMCTGSPRHAKFKGDAEREYAWFAVSDSLPGLSMSAERAARKVVEACRRGDAEAVLGLPAKLGVLARALAPELTSALLAFASARLPQGTRPEARPGHASETPLTRSWVTRLSQKAALRNNEASPA